MGERRTSVAIAGFLVGGLVFFGGLKLVAAKAGSYVDPLAELVPVGAVANVDISPPGVVGANLTIRQGTVYEGDVAKGVAKGTAVITEVDLNDDTLNEVVASVTLTDGRKYYFVQQFFDTDILTPLFGVGSVAVSGTEIVTTEPSGVTRWELHETISKRIYGFAPKEAG
jgi:hypothetical protein